MISTIKTNYTQLAMREATRNAKSTCVGKYWEKSATPASSASLSSGRGRDPSVNPKTSLHSILSFVMLSVLLMLSHCFVMFVPDESMTLDRLCICLSCSQSNRVCLQLLYPTEIGSPKTKNEPYVENPSVELAMISFANASGPDPCCALNKSG